MGISLCLEVSVWLCWNLLRFQYQWFWFVMDALVYTAVGFLSFFFLWTNLSREKRELITKFLDSRRTTGLLTIIVAVLFLTSLVYDFYYLWNLR